MKILFIQKEGGIFGAEQFQLRTIPALMKSGIQVEFLRLYTNHQLGKDSPFVQRLKDLGVKVYQVKITNIPRPSQFLQIKSVIKKGEYDLVHTHLIHADLYGAVVKKFLLPKMKLVSTKHGYEEDYNNRFGFDPAYKRKDLYWRINKFSESVANKSFAISDGLRNLFVETGISNAKKLKRIHYGFEMKDFIPDPKRDNYRFAEQQLVIAGRLVGFKGHRYALESLTILKKDYPDIKLLVIGVGELEKELKAYTTKLGLVDNVVFLGFSDQVQNFMYHSDVVLIPSIAEGFGVVFLEAINQNTPIAAFDVPAGNEVLPKEYHEFLAKPFDVQEYARKIKLMLEEPHKLDVAIKSAEERMLSYFKLDRMVSEMIGFYQEVIEK